jgi:hypothetical protein
MIMYMRSTTQMHKKCSERSGCTHHASVFIPETFIVDEIHPFIISHVHALRLFFFHFI